MTEEIESLRKQLELQKEINTVISKSFYRCARDLAHSIPYIVGPMKEVFEPRSKDWIEISRDPEGYRLELHKELNHLEMTVERYRKHLGPNNPVEPDYEPMPF